MPLEIRLDRTWLLEDEPIGGGGFGTVYKARSGNDIAAAKLIPKDPGAERELLFVELNDAEKVCPILDRGETDEAWVLVMPLAEKSLRKEMQDVGGRLPLAVAVEVASDLLTALSSIDGQVVHRDLKPENILKFDHGWCLADFGISRYAEATTNSDTRKFAMSPPYAAPERWRNERVTSATDIYSFGVVLYELLAGGLPFAGPTIEDFREQHLHHDPPDLTGAPDSIIALIQECLYKSPEARPSSQNLFHRIGRVEIEERAEGLATLEAANRAAVAVRSEQERQASEARSMAERRTELGDDAEKAIERIGEVLRTLIVDAAPAAFVRGGQPVGWTIELQDAVLRFAEPSRVSAGALEEFDVVLFSEIELTIPSDYHGYEGRSHSLWFCDAQAEGAYGWFETAFMVTPLINEQSTQDPFALSPGPEAAQAIGAAMGSRQVAWPFSRLEPGAVDDFLNQWAGWFGEAASGKLSHPSGMPERDPSGSWRRG
jgi:serine/threonine-protein kinase